VTGPAGRERPMSDAVRVATRLVAYAEDLAATGDAQVGDAFTDIPEADALIKADPNAFLLGMLFTQGIPAERAWAGPWLLEQRLGHLDLARLASERAAVAEAVARTPALHRFKVTLAGWISDAAARLLECWGGDASAIWPAGAHVLEVSERLSAFRGIGRKKAAMAVEILVRHFGVPLAGSECGTVAYDVQVRRVFLRSGLIEGDTPEEVVTAAAAACPQAPGSLDLATWLVGRQWCRPKSPKCDECALGDVCERRVWLDVEGVGARR
jgi:endonuclease-3